MTLLTRHFHRLPLGRKLTVVLLVPCLVVLLVACLALIGFQIQSARADFVRQIKSVADIVSANSTAAIAFKDSNVANEILGSLHANPHVLSAILVLPDGTLFAQYGYHHEAPEVAAEVRFTFRARDALMVKPVFLEGQQVATLNLISDHRAAYAGLRNLVLWVLLLMGAVGAGVAVLLSNWARHCISAPLLRLTGAVRTVADCQDYTVRVAEEPGPELGILTRAFNQMLGRIQEQEEAIARLSRLKLDAIINAIEGIVWECAPDSSSFTFVSRQCERILGFSPEEWMARSDFWQAHLHPDDAGPILDDNRQRTHNGQPYIREYRMLAAEGRVVWIRESGSVQIDQGRAIARRGIFQDFTSQKAADEKLEQLNHRLIETSRRVGMAEVATGVLHNVGNVLNSVNVSTNLVLDQVRQSKMANLPKLAALFEANASHLGHFLTTDPRGKQIPSYLSALAKHLGAERSSVLTELQGLHKHIDHIKDIIAMQQTYAKVSGVHETVSPAQLVEDALQLNAGCLRRDGIEILCRFAEVPMITVEKHKVLQILVNLIRNAQHALVDSEQAAKRVEIHVEAPASDRIRVEVIDNGVGIAPENLTRIFQHGFTTRKNGHGFGLHSGALASKELGGHLSVASAGPGLGASFALHLPICPPKS